MPESSHGTGAAGGRGQDATRIGRYEIVEKFGQGGMGIVYRAFDTLLQRDVALKVISGTLDPGSDQRERFFREARAAGQLSHPNIITIYDLGEQEGQPYLAMELLKGEDLQTRLAGASRMSLAHRVDITMQVCEGLEYAHAHGVVHRDVKPANIFLTDGGPAKILDFGLARLVTSELTDSNMMMGTVNYMAPEQVRGERADRRSDVFSLGVVFYELLGGRKAFDGESFAATLYKILQDDPAPLATLDPALPDDLIAIVNRALAKPRDERYQQMGDMLRDLAVYRQELVARDPGSGGRQAHAALLDQGADARSGARGATPRPAPAPAPTELWPRTPAQGTPVSGSVMPERAARIGPRVWVPAAVLVLALAGVSLWTVGRTWRRPPLPNTSPTKPVVDRSAARAAVAQAMRALDAGDVAGAQRQAEAALAIDPDSVEARDVRDRAAVTAATVQRGLVDARTAYAAGRYDEASRAAGNVLMLAPAQPEARKLMEDAEARSRGRGAAEARARMIDARNGARTAGASRTAAAAYAAALDADRAAQRLYDAGHPGEATLKFYEASGLYRSAELSAQAASSSRAASASPAPASPASGPPTSEPAASASPPSALPRSAPAAPPSPPPVSTSQSPAPPPVAPASRGATPSSRGQPGPADAPERTEATRPAPVSAAPTDAPEPPAERAIADLIGRYKTGLEARDLDALKRIWPTLGGAQETALRSEFQHASRIVVDVVSPRIRVDGGTATATFVRRYDLVTTDGQRLASQSLTTMGLRRTAAGWVIDRLQFDPVR